MYEPVTVGCHDAILGQYFCAVIFVVVTGKLVYSKSEQKIDCKNYQHLVALSYRTCNIICILKEKKVLQKLIQAYINLHTF